MDKIIITHDSFTLIVLSRKDIFVEWENVCFLATDGFFAVCVVQGRATNKASFCGFSTTWKLSFTNNF